MIPAETKSEPFHAMNGQVSPNHLGKLVKKQTETLFKMEVGEGVLNFASGI